MHARAGVLILSEFAGAAQSLGAGAILVNPWNITDMAAAIEDALTMSDQARPHPAAVYQCGITRCPMLCATCSGRLRAVLTLLTVSTWSVLPC